LGEEATRRRRVPELAYLVIELLLYEWYPFKRDASIVAETRGI
jgi:hypothetical protein